MIELNERHKTKQDVFKLNPTLDKSFKLLYGHEPKKSYNTRLKKSAQRVTHGKPGPIECYGCGMEDESVLEIHHILDDDGISGNYLRENVHGTGAAQYRYIIKNGVNNDGFKWVLLCGNCHNRRHHKTDSHSVTC